MQPKFEKWIEKLLLCRLFSGLTAGEIREFLECMNATIGNYTRGELIISQGEKVRDIGIILCGEANAVKIMQGGSQSFGAVIKDGNIFADLLAANEKKASPVTIFCKTDTSVLFLPYNKLTHRCEKHCKKHDSVQANLSAIYSDKFFELYDRIDCLTCGDLREKVMKYLYFHMSEKSKSFTVPHDREAMAQYLNVDRSALSRQLSLLKKQGYIDYYKNSFKICKE